MKRIDRLHARYERSARLTANGVELVVVGDPVGALLNDAVRQVVLAAEDDATNLWENLLGAARRLRWRVLTQPQPLEFNMALRQAAIDATNEAVKLERAVAPNVVPKLKALGAAAAQVLAEDPAVGKFLLDSIQEVGAEMCVVVAVNGAAAAGLESWLGPLGVATRAAGQLAHDQIFVEQGYAVGPPRFFPSSLTTAPLTEELSFYMPYWFADRSIPCSKLAPYAEGAIQVKARLFMEGDTAEPEVVAAERTMDEDDLLPRPVWTVPDHLVREPGVDEVAAHRLLLGGGYAIWLDEGERIRAVNPTLPEGERVTQIEVGAVSRGTYLLLRDGQTERQALYDAALQLMGEKAQAATASQARWKGTLQSRLNQEGHIAVTRQLETLGVRTLERVRAWTEPTLIRPQNDNDFKILLHWLGLPQQPAYELANELRRRRYQASVKITEELEKVFGVADIAALMRDGHLRLDAKNRGFRGMVARRVLAVSPHTEIISRRNVRVPFVDRGAKWLE